MNLRTAQSFHDAVASQPNFPFYSEFAIDLPRLNSITPTSTGTLASYLGLIDDEGVISRSMRFRRWSTQLAPMIGTACKYISGPRHLSDVATNGLGSYAYVAQYTSNISLEIHDHASVQGGNPAQLINATYQSFHFTNLNATLQVRDPVASDLSIQYQMIAQTNIDISYAHENEGQTTSNLGNLCAGPFWDYAI